MKNLFAIFAIAAMTVACAGNANKPAEAEVVVEETVVVDSTACADSTVCDSTATPAVK